MTKKERNIPRFFAAANSYKGFVSYFDSIFKSEDFDRIFVLKGGPGTGKSSLMRRISSTFSEYGCDVEEILCSSDPDSLDGVTVSYMGKRVAILDGTSPHERDAIIPGAIDELICLGDAWDEAWLSARKDEISEIQREKGNAYKSAYAYLKIAGGSADLIEGIIRSNLDKSKVKSKAEYIFKDILLNGTGKVSTRLISSFGRRGESRLNTLSPPEISVIRVSGDRYSAGLFLRLCYEFLRYREIDFTHFPNALDPSLTDAVYLPHNSMALILAEEGEINADEFTSLSPLDYERTRVAKMLRDDALNEARRWFAIASDLHFRLEKLYGEAMNFNMIDHITTEKISKIANILKITI